MIEALYQVHVETRGGDVIPVGPRFGKEAAERFVMAINRQIIGGREREWSNPHIIQMTRRSN